MNTYETAGFKRSSIALKTKKVGEVFFGGAIAPKKGTVSPSRNGLTPGALSQGSEARNKNPES
jgi:hypothetical protein